MESILWQSSSYTLNIYVCCMLDPHSSPPHFVIICTSLFVARLFTLLLLHAPSVVATQQSPSLKCWDNFLLSVLLLTQYLRELVWIMLHGPFHRQWLHARKGERNRKRNCRIPRISSPTPPLCFVLRLRMQKGGRICGTLRYLLLVVTFAMLGCIPPPYL